MKQKDIVLVIIVAFIGGIVSIVLTNMIFVSSKDKQLTAEVVDPISADFNEPDKLIFNESAVNPTQQIQIGDSTNTAPF